MLKLKKKNIYMYILKQIKITHVLNVRCPIFQFLWTSLHRFPLVQTKYTQIYSCILQIIYWNIVYFYKHICLSVVHLHKKNIRLAIYMMVPTSQVDISKHLLQINLTQIIRICNSKILCIVYTILYWIHTKLIYVFIYNIYIFLFFFYTFFLCFC